MKRILGVVVLLFAAGLAAQSPTVPPPPTVTPIDPTPIVAIAAQALNQNTVWTAWAQKGIQDTGTKVDGLQAQLDALKAQVAAIPQSPPGPQGPAGVQGVPGTPGVSPTIQIGTVVSVPCTTPASVTNSGTVTAAIFNFSIPKCGTTATTTAYALSVSTSAVRTGAVNLSDLTVKGTVYIFTSALTNVNDPNPSGIAGVCYWLDAPVTSAPVTCEGGVPWDFMGSASATTANPWNSASVANGQHTIIQRVIPIVGVPEIDSVSFTVAN